MKNIEKFLEFNGKVISLLLTDGAWWIAIKPICEALGLDYTHYRKVLNENPILSKHISEQTAIASDGKSRNMICLPEKYIYGWIFSINSDKPSLLEYQEKCYEVLYDYFHGAITGRMTVLKEQVEMRQQIFELEQSLLDSPQYVKIQEIKKQLKASGNKLKHLDNDLLQGQLSIDF